MRSKLRLFFLGITAFFPSRLKCLIYQHFFGYKMGKRIHIGLSIINAENCFIDDDVSIGHFNIFSGIKKLSIGDHARIRHLNIFHGGDEITLGRYTEIMRLNQINSLCNPDIANPVDPKFILGDGSIIASSHKIDFTDRVEIGKRVVLGGRNSSLWTHNRQRTKPIFIGDHSYIGSEIRVAPGGEIPPNCIIGIGSVITKKFESEYKLIAGVPAKIIKELDEEDKFLTESKTRSDLPDEI